MLTIPNDRLTLWSPEELAEALGVKEQTLADWRNARTGPAFIRTAGIVHTASFRSNSRQMAPRTSPERGGGQDGQFQRPRANAIDRPY